MKINLKQRFRSSIRRGTGETHILLKDNPTVDFSKEIIKATLFNYAYDQQCECRDEYLAELINLCSRKEEILPVIYEALNNDENDDWSTGQLFSVAAIFAKQGDELAKKAVYENYYRCAMDGAELCGQYEIVEIDGLKGLKYVAETRGKYLSANSDEWEDSFFVDKFQEENPSIDVYAKIRKLSEDNSNVRKYLETIEANKFSVKKRDAPNYDYDFIKKRIDDDKIDNLSTHLIKKLSENDIKKLADDFLKETNKLKQRKFLRVFAAVAFPYDYKYLLNLAKTKPSRTNRVVEFAVDSLRFFTGEDIRRFAIEQLSVTNKPDIYLSLLVGNYKQGDWKLLKSIAEKCKNADTMHSLAISYIDIYKANPTKECKEPLEVIYDKLNCGLHREDLVKLLIENDVLSEKIRNEIPFDCKKGTRKLYAGLTD